MARWSEEELINVLEHTSDYRSTAVQASREEIARRGGIESVKEAVARKSGAEAPGYFSRIGQWAGTAFDPLIPEERRFANYPTLRSLAAFFSILAILGAAVWGVGTIAGVYTVLFTDNFWPVYLIVVVYGAVAAIGCKLLAEVIGVLVDIERNTRRSAGI